MNNFKTITFLFFITVTLIFSATASANEPQLFMYNNKEKNVVAGKGRCVQLPLDSWQVSVKKS